MLLYELAIELGVRSTEMSESAERLGLGTILPTEKIDADQAAQLRAAHAPAAPAARAGSVGERAMPPMVVPGAPAGGGMHTFDPASNSGEDLGSRIGRYLLIAVAAVAVAGLFAYMATNSGADQKRQAQVSKDLKAWNDAPTPTVPPGQTAGGVVLAPDQPVDKAKLCAAADAMYRWELRLSGSHIDADWAEVRRTAKDDRGQWDQAIMAMAANGPANLKVPLAAYRVANSVTYDGMAASTDRASMLTFLNHQDHTPVQRATDGIYRIIVPLCGNPGH